MSMSDDNADVIMLRFHRGDGSVVFTDGINSKGIVYAGDYSANWTDHSLVTKKWVTDNFVGV